jgi:hypothetical protein
METHQPVCAMSATSANHQTQGAERYARLEFQLKKTIFRIHVLSLTIDVDDQTATAIDSIVTGRRRTDELENAVVSQYMETRNADIALDYQYSFGYGRFMGGIRETSQLLVRADLIDAASAERIDLDVESRFAFLREQGVRDGDHHYYSLRGDSVLTHYVDVDGNTKLDDVRVGAEWRLWLLGNYFAAGTNFRNGLLDLVFGR